MQSLQDKETCKSPVHCEQKSHTISLLQCLNFDLGAVQHLPDVVQNFRDLVAQSHGLLVLEGRSTGQRRQVAFGKPHLRELHDKDRKGVVETQSQRQTSPQQP